MLELRSGVKCLMFGKPTCQQFPLLSLPPGVEARAPSRQPQAKNRRRGPGHDDGAVQAERINGAPLVWAAQRSEGKPDALLPENTHNGVIVVAIRVAENRQAHGGFLLQVFLRTPYLLPHLFGSNFGHDGVCSRVRSERQSLPGKLTELIPIQHAFAPWAVQPEFRANRIHQLHCLPMSNRDHVILDRAQAFALLV